MLPVLRPGTLPAGNSLHVLRAFWLVLGAIESILFRFDEWRQSQPAATWETDEKPVLLQSRYN